MECQDRGLLSYQYGYESKISNLISQLNFFCGDQVSISHISNNLIYIHYQNEFIRNDFLSVPYCFYIGFFLKFITWEPNFNLSTTKIDQAPIWISIHSLPFELNHNEILKHIGFVVGDLIRIEENFLKFNNIKMLINMEIELQEFKPLKIIPNRSIYELKYKRFKKHIKETIKVKSNQTITLKHSEINLAL